MAVRLFIENKEVELDKSVQFAITKQFEDVTNPTDIINEWSKTVSIPFSVHNNELFGHIYNPDKVTVGVPTNLLSKMAFRSNDFIMHNDNVRTIYYGHPEILYPSTLYDESLTPMIDIAILNSYSVVRGTSGTTYETLLSERSSLGKQFCTFTLTSDMTGAQRYLTVKIQAIPRTLQQQDQPYVSFNLGEYPDGKYNLTFDTAVFNTTTKQFDLKNLVLTRSESLVWADNMNFGVYFDPMYKLNFRLEFDNFVLMTGYAKMNEVKQANGTGTYEITLFGQIGKVFQEMQKITFDKTSDLTDYIIEGDKYVSEYITKDLVYSSWTSNGQMQSILYDKESPQYHVTDIIGFAPNNAFCEGFDYKTFQYDDKHSRTFEDVLEETDASGKTFYDYTGVEPSTVIPDGMLPREIGEYRSYQQLPFIYWNKLFKMFVEKSKEITGYDIVLDNNWFMISNPYWFRLVYMLKPLNTHKSEKVSNTYYVSISPDISWDTQSYMTTDTKVTRLMAYETSTEAIPIINGYRTVPALFKMSDDYDVVLNSYFPLRLQYDAKYVNSQRKTTFMNKTNGLVVEACFYNNSTDTLASSNKYLICADNFTGSTDEYDQVFRVGTASQASAYSDTYTIDLNLTLAAFRKTCGDWARFEMHAHWLNLDSPFKYDSNTDYSPASVMLVNEIEGPIHLDIIKNNFRSSSHFVLNDLWDNEYNLFSEILKYCKMFRIGIFLDDYNKKITFKALKDYFSGYTVTDWTDKIDKSKDFVIKPITFENKYVLFNYEDSETKLGENYKTKFGVNYGDYRLTTQYNFNTETTELFEGITPSITYTDNVLSWTSIYDNHKIIYSFPSEIYVNCKDDDNKFVNTFGSFFFHRGTADFSTEPTLYLRSVKISDDTEFQQGNSSYFYTQNAGDSVVNVTKYPKLDIVYSNNMCVFNVPKENYTYNSNYEGKKSIYSNFWEKYINERYNIQNKVITCYVLLRPIDYNNFQFNKFVKVGHQLCMVNKIYDYDVTSSQSTKVDLITIQDVSGYTTNNY